ncbi:hypothetical protein [Enterovibrio nigricans]|uniref:Uncharacterized protein n=1 Tax=Enterovibrio nigricans DSM 22720 TaxID=1121868 RepID=A0A1T4VVD7_9GAMM|nr:hypothetical protein [Enterovibrio nigricans]PKF49319.1 hypothetical protein AT251_19775 [Enterovibrio nigricans]SKA68984.1 hypothetical protein SAMN02745132_04383 [Enterovibrio nigricans DSM 22720]
MARKFQFFTHPETNRNQFTYLDMASQTYHAEKNALLSQGLVVTDDAIYAENEEEAVEKFKSHFIYVMEEYNASTNPFYSIQFALQWLWRKVTGKQV